MFITEKSIDFLERHCSSIQEILDNPKDSPNWTQQQRVDAEMLLLGRRFFCHWREAKEA
jgi:hypothetical protein